MTKHLAFTLLFTCAFHGVAHAGGTDCDPQIAGPAFTYDAAEPQTQCRVIVAADASAVAARCGGDKGASTAIVDDTLGLSLSRGESNAGYYAAPTDTFEVDVLASDIVVLLENARTCLATDTCKTGPNPPDIVRLLADPFVPIGNITLDVADRPDADQTGLLDGIDLGAGLGSALEGNPPIVLNYIMLGDETARVWQDPGASGGLPSFNLQILETEAQQCQK